MNKLSENIRMAITSLFSNKIRALLTTLGIGIGIASVIILVSLGQAVQVYVNKQFLSAGADLIYVRQAAVLGQQGPPNAVRTASSALTDRDVTLLQDPFNVSNVKAVVPLVQITRTTTYGTSDIRGRIYGTTETYFDIMSRTVASGRLFDAEDVAAKSRVAVLGQTTIRNLFPTNAEPLGESIRIGDVSFKVIGTLQKYGGSSFGVDQDDLIVIPLSTLYTHLETTRSISGQLPVNTIYLQASSTSAIDGIVQSATELLRREHKIKPGKDDDFQVTTQKDLLSSTDQVIGLLTVFLSVIGGISLLVGGIGVMNIMLVTVTERTREIGLRKAVGARHWDVLFQFLIEAIVLSFVGGFAGLAVAFVVTTILRLVLPDLNPSVSLPSIVLAVSVTTLIGLFFGMYPANRAASLSPIKALRFE